PGITATATVCDNLALYGGLMLTPDGPKVIEFNARLGDPETQVVLPRMESDLLDVFEAILDGTIDRTLIAWSPRPAVGVVLASGGYPDAYETGYAVTGLDGVDDDVAVFHAGTALSGDGAVVTAGGRVLTVAATGETLEDARAHAYENAARIGFEGAQYRRDIAALAPAASGR
ncbi:MAG: phosphoribosylamine--glycine ligase, partial [Chloroflexota bacterium]|nr:phosphoribosylamine--glycine ligase [Chloroflexota bacterium]